MYIDVVPNRNSPPAILLRESYRQAGRVKKRTLANLSKLPQETVERIRSALTGQPLALEEAVCGAIYGVLFTLNELAKQLGLYSAVGQSRVAVLAMFLVLSRVAHQGSRLGAVRWARDHAVNAVLGLNYFDEEDLYEALEWIASQQEAIEDKLYETYVQQTGQTPVLILYDVTSSYLEGDQNELAAYGYNRDGKQGKKQIVIGLLTAKDGEPLSIQVFEGNTADTQTVEAQVDKLVRRFKVKNIVFVGDRGMIKAKGKHDLGRAYFKYITALTDPQIRKLLRQQVIQPDLFDEHVVEVSHEGKRLILRCDPVTQRKERYRREDKLQRLKAQVSECNAFVERSKRADPKSGLTNLQAWSKRHKIASFVELKLNGRRIECLIDAEAKKEDELLDGCYCIESDVPEAQLTKDEVHDRYKDLQHVERDFRNLKTACLEVRPIFVRKEQRTRGHIFISMLSLKIVRLMEKRLKQVFGPTTDNTQAETVESSLLALSRLCLHHYQIDGQTLSVIPRLDSRQEQILAALQVKIKAPDSLKPVCTQ
jgi:transposase